MKNKSYANGIVYQIYPLSFCDSNNDGYGDIQGIISKLDYLKEIGVRFLWLSPIYESPMKDNGYDISNYYKINPIFGSMEDFDLLIKEANNRDLKIIMDLVINHTSNEHEWFKEALKNKDSKYRDYYIFKEGKNGKVPNNRDSAFTGTCWEKVDNEENMYYLHLYTKEQPDLNYRNEEVIQEVMNILRFYLEKGVAGFRCDVINQIYKSSFDDGKFRFYSKGKEFYENQEENFKILERIQNEVVKKYNAFLIGETSNVTPSIGRKFLERGALDLFFEFEHQFCDDFKLIPIFKKKYRPKNLINPILKWQAECPWIGAYLENHDQRRSLTRFGYASNYSQSSKVLAMFLLTLRGTPFIFEGQELGTLDYKDFKYSDLNDSMSFGITKTASKILHIKEEKVFELVNKTVNRDHARYPMLWDNSINAGFNKGHKTWLKVNEIYKNGVNVQDELLDPNSTLNFYKKIIKFRNESDVLKYGDFKRLKSNKNVAKFIRKYQNESYLIVINLSNKKIKDRRENLEVLFTNDENIDLNYLNPLQGIIYKMR